MNYVAALLRNFLGALDTANITPKRFLLQTGAKNYGIHLGPTRTPHVESDPRVTLDPNFYYPQEDALFEWCKKHPGTHWNVICPAWIIGTSTVITRHSGHVSLTTICRSHDKRCDERIAPSSRLRSCASLERRKLQIQWRLRYLDGRR